jgi:anti-anti-sigma regulatory factor
MKESRMLRITSHENGGTVCLKLEGMLKGAWVPEMERSWRNVNSDRNRALIVDLTDVEFVDTAGKYLLALMHAHGARFIAATPLMTELVAEISAGADLPH